MKCKRKNRRSRRMRYIAFMLLFVFTCQLVAPNVSMALTTGPSQPEVQGFEPVGTTDMVDMFTGSFVYNIPLLDVEGYPVNISYHGGITMEQEASWVGLGWNINPGAINRTVRGVPDDFNGDTVAKDFNIKPEKTMRVGVGAGVELAGVGDPVLSVNLSVGANLNVSNYRGVSCDFSLGGGVNVFHCVSAGVNMGVGSQTGASIDYNAGLSMSSSQTMSKDMACGVGVNVGSGYSTRSGVKDLNLSFSVTSSNGNGGVSSISSSDNIPIGVKNFVPVITNSSTMSSIYGRVKLGGEAFSLYFNGNINAMFNVLTYSNDASRDAYGYLYMQNAPSNKSVLDFTRDKDGMFNKSMQYLPPANMTYDIYSVSGQGTGGVFRPFRNDFGNVYDPYVTSGSTSKGGEVEIGLGETFEAGLDYNNSGTIISAGPWAQYQRTGTSKGFTRNDTSKIYENVFFKQAGELTEVDSNYFLAIGQTNAITPDAAQSLPVTKPNALTKRDPRANLIYYHTAQEDTVSGVGTNPAILNYAPAFSYPTPSVNAISRIGTGNFQRKKDQVSEIVQVQKDGRKYVYGIPAMNNVQREVTFSADGTKANLGDGLVAIGSTDATTNNPNGRDNYYSSTVTPSYAHSYLLSAVLSSDYLDVTGNGITDDDLGSFTKFNYTRTDSDYRWVAPYTSTIDSAQYNQGFWSDPLDDKGSFVCGSREQWILHSIETKNFIAEFYTSQRSDAKGIQNALLNHGEGSIYNGYKSAGSFSYELDSIKLYNKHDRYIHASTAVPVKSVYFAYDNSLCNGVLNGSSGKLTLKKIFFSYGNSMKSMISPYQFGYGQNPGYNLASKDRWGNYKPSNSGFTNYEYPYVNQNDAADNTYAASWTLNNITLPSGGVISANFESNDYAYVQDKPVNEMFMVQGIGNSTNYVNGSQLFTDINSPFLYAYFSRRLANELCNLTFAQNYLGTNFKSGGPNCVYFNFNVRLTGSNNTFEQIKGYANVTDVGKCSVDTTKGYIKFAAIKPTGGGGYLNPVTYTAMNVSRYNLPQIIFPGSDPNESDLKNILSGLKGSFGELVSMGRSPVVYLVNKGGGQVVNLNKSYVRLQSVGLCKKGGGQRVKSLSFTDQWQTLSGGNEVNATYGKQYNYTIADPLYGTISSGVASYEPMIGGDENPLRQPVQYTVQSGSSWPPNDPVDLYQETPIGETLFPSPQVGYSSVTITSINASKGRSSQGVDQYQFYTAKDFPAQVIATSIDENSSTHFDFFNQNNLLTVKQGYTLIFNDMHGKPKKVEHDVYNPASQTLQPISYQVYNYRQSGNQLNNYVPCLENIGGSMVLRNRQLGVEADVTMDSRQKDEVTNSSTYNYNFNFFIIPCIIPIPVPIPYGFTWTNTATNEFQSATVTKVIQQYGILDNVQSYNEGAQTTLKNEIYDPNTGQPIVTSITNEFRDKEYSTNIPAYWVYKGMGLSYNNIKYRDTGYIVVGPHHVGTLYMGNTSPLVAGDELSVYYTDSLNIKRHAIGWVLGIVPEYIPDTFCRHSSLMGGLGCLYYGGPDTIVSTHTVDDSITGPYTMTYYVTYLKTCTGLNVLPRFPINTPGWNYDDTLKKVSIEVINSGQKNMLQDNAESYTSMDYPISSTTSALNTSLTNLISLNAKTFADSNTMILHDYIANADTVNPWAIGERGEWRLFTDYEYKAPRNYSGVTARNSGLFNATGLFAPPSGLPTSCFLSPYNYLAPYFADQNWHKSRTVTKYSPDGKEIENVNAVGIYSTAVFGYNQELPIAVASNAKQGEIFADGFEDYNLLQPVVNILKYTYSPFNNFASVSLGIGSVYNILNITPTSGPAISNTQAHTGASSLLIPSGGAYYPLTVPVNNNVYTGMINNYNNYFINNPLSPYIFTSANEYLPFELNPGETYIASYWIYQLGGPSSTTTNYSLSGSVGVKVGTSSVVPVTQVSNLIDGWQQVQATFTLPVGTTSVQFQLPTGFYIDDVRIFPSNANMKSFVYNPFSEKLMATLDENNFATIYEYDQEGKLVRVKKETTKGIMTASESRSGNPK